MNPAALRTLSRVLDSLTEIESTENVAIGANYNGDLTIHLADEQLDVEIKRESGEWGLVKLF